MKVLFFIRSLGIGGSERQVAVLAAGLARRSHDVAVAVLYSGGPLEAMLQGSGARLVALGKSGRWDIAPLIRLRRLIKVERPDVVYAFLPTQTTLAAILLPRHLPTKLVFGIRAAGMDLRRYDYVSALTYWSEAALSHRADLIIANSNAGRDDAVRRGFPANRITVVPNGIDTDTMHPDPAAGQESRRTWGIGDGEFVVGIVARLDPMKDHRTFLAAAAIFAREHPDARFVCVGDGAPAYRRELHDAARSLGLDGRVVWTGDRGDVTAAYNGFDIATLSSAFGEGFSNAVGEAMACGIPIVATDVGDSRLVIGGCGEVVAPGRPDLLATTWTQLRRRTQSSELRRAARQRIVAEFSVDRLVDRSEGALTALAAAPTVAERR